MDTRLSKGIRFSFDVCLTLPSYQFFHDPWKIPNLSLGDIITLLPIALLNAAGHGGAVIAMFQVGGGSFTHVIKASEPVVSVILGLLINGIVPKPLTALSLLPITYGSNVVHFLVAE